MSGWDGAPGPRGRARWKTYAKYGLAFAGVFLLLWAIWNPDNRVQWVLTGMLALATWGVWLGLDRGESETRGSGGGPSTSRPGPAGRATPVREPGRERRDRHQ